MSTSAETENLKMESVGKRLCRNNSTANQSKVVQISQKKTAKRKYSFPCNLCNKTYKLAANLKKHKKNCHSTPTEWKYRCVHCGRRFLFEHALQLHLYSHSDANDAKSDETADFPIEQTNAKRRDNDFDQILTAQVTTAAVQQANLPIITTPPQVNSAEKELESSEEKLTQMAVSNELAESDDSDRSAEPQTSAPEIPFDGGDIRLSMSTLSNRFATTSPSELLPDIIEWMKNWMEMPLVMGTCQRLIGQYSVAQLRQLESPLKRRLTAVLLSNVKFHCHADLFFSTVSVDRICQLLEKIIDLDHNCGEIDVYLDSIDCLLDLICDGNKISTPAAKSTLNLLKEIAVKCDSDRSKLIGQKFVEKICKSLWLQSKSEYDEKLTISWRCLTGICEKSLENSHVLVNTVGGIGLFHHCYDEFYGQTELLTTMIWLMMKLSERDSLQHRLMTAKTNLTILWEIWRGTKEERISSICAQIFTNFLSVPITKGLWGHPTLEEVKVKLSEEKK